MDRIGVWLGEVRLETFRFCKFFLWIASLPLCPSTEGVPYDSLLLRYTNQASIFAKTSRCSQDNDRPSPLAVDVLSTGGSAADARLNVRESLTSHKSSRTPETPGQNQGKRKPCGEDEVTCRRATAIGRSAPAGSPRHALFEGISSCHCREPLRRATSSLPHRWSRSQSIYPKTLGSPRRSSSFSPSLSHQSLLTPIDARYANSLHSALFVIYTHAPHTHLTLHPSPLSSRSYKTRRSPSMQSHCKGSFVFLSCQTTRANHVTAALTSRISELNHVLPFRYVSDAHVRQTTGAFEACSCPPSFLPAVAIHLLSFHSQLAVSCILPSGLIHVSPA